MSGVTPALTTARMAIDRWVLAGSDLTGDETDPDRLTTPSCIY
jgi:hypothetical protein